jgi:hypothetical protein
VSLTKLSQDVTAEEFCQNKPVMTFPAVNFQYTVKREEGFEIPIGSYRSAFFSIDEANCPIKEFALSSSQNLKGLVWIEEDTKTIKFDLEKISGFFSFQIVALGQNRVSEAY